MDQKLAQELSPLRRVAVYCGATLPRDPNFVTRVTEFGEFLGEYGITLIYGGSNTGTMKVLAEAVASRGGKVIGVFTNDLPEEMLRPDLDETLIATTLAERKAIMLRRADAVLALPGSFGTWDELFDALAIDKICHDNRSRPAGALNIDGFFNPLVELIERSVSLGFTAPAYRDLLTVADTPAELLRRLARRVAAQLQQYAPAR